MGGMKGTVLIAEDEKEIRDLLTLLFQTEGFSVLSASDGKEALDLVHEHQDEIVLLVTDLGLPKLEGIDLIRATKSVIPSLKIIAATGFGHHDVRVRLREAGVQSFFPKPFSPLELLAAAKDLLSDRQVEKKEG